MLNEFFNLFSTFWVIFSFSFLVALTGAMAPGPLLTYTIIKSVNSGRRGYLIGAWVILGHALLEMVIVFFLLMGFSFVLKNMMVVRFIGITGGIILVWFGTSLIKDITLGKISTEFLKSSGNTETDSNQYNTRGLENPIVGGIIVSMSNPYWWVWWATIGFAFMIQFDVSLKKWPELIAFFLGHEAGDLLWYVIVSFLAFFGIRHLNRKTYYGILVVCGIFMILFGAYLGISPFFKEKI